MDERASKLFVDLYQDGDSYMNVVARFEDKRFKNILSEDAYSELKLSFADAAIRFAKINPDFLISFCLDLNLDDSKYRVVKNVAEKYPSEKVKDLVFSYTIPRARIHTD